MAGPLASVDNVLNRIAADVTGTRKIQSRPGENLKLCHAKTAQAIREAFNPRFFIGLAMATKSVVSHSFLCDEHKRLVAEYYSGNQDGELTPSGYTTPAGELMPVRYVSLADFKRNYMDKQQTTSGFSLSPVQTAARSALLSWQVFILREDSGDFHKGQKVLVRRNTETPDSKRGVVSFWVLSPKMKKCVCWSDTVLHESTYVSKADSTQQDARYDRMFWRLIEPGLQVNQRLRQQFGYIFYKYGGADIRLSDGANVIVLRTGATFTVYQYGHRWSIRSMNKRRVLVDVDGFTVGQINKLLMKSQELPPVSQPSKFEQLK